MSLATADRLAHEPLLKPIEVQRHRDQQTNDCPRINEAHPARTDSNFTISTHSFEGSLPRVTLLSNGLDPDDVIDKLGGNSFGPKQNQTKAIPSAYTMDAISRCAFFLFSRRSLSFRPFHGHQTQERSVSRGRHC